MKLYSLLIAALLTTTVAFGQRLGGNHNEGVLLDNSGFGIKGGLNVASVYKVPSGINSEGITSYHFGIYGRLGLSEKLGLQLEALYSRRGANFETRGFPEAGKAKFRFDYIDVPLLLTYSIIGDNTLSLMIGPQASLMLTAKDTEDKEIDKEPFNTFDFGGAAGLQFGYKMLRVGARYNLSFLDVVKSNDAARNTFGDSNFKNHFGQVYVAVEF